MSRLTALLFEAAGQVYVTNHDRDIVFEGRTYKSDGSLTSVEGPLRGGDFPRYSFDITCNPGSIQRTVFSPGSGPEPATITQVKAVFAEADGSLSWEKDWSFEGVLGEGAMGEDSYSGILQHPFEWRLHALPRRYWTARAIRAANANDAGGDYVASISRDQLSVWRGHRMKPAKK